LHVKVVLVSVTVADSSLLSHLDICHFAVISVTYEIYSLALLEFPLYEACFTHLEPAVSSIFVNDCW